MLLADSQDEANMEHHEQRKPARRPQRNYRREMQQRAEQLEEAQPEDAQGAWPQTKLLEMDQAYRLAFLRELRGPPKR
jgi:hypothetical protein